MEKHIKVQCSGSVSDLVFGLYTGWLQQKRLQMKKRSDHYKSLPLMFCKKQSVVLLRDIWLRIH